jgi:hypothetical protein
MNGVSFASRCLLCVQRGCCAGQSVRVRYGKADAPMPRLVVCPHCDRAAGLSLRDAVPGSAS